MNWIKIEDRLPQKWYSVLWADIDGNVGEGFIDTDSVWRTPGDQLELRNITHWGLLPMPPTNPQKQEPC